MTGDYRNRKVHGTFVPTILVYIRTLYGAPTKIGIDLCHLF